MSNKSCYYRIALTELGLDTGYFLARGLPPPELPEYNDFSIRRPASQGGESRQGYKSVSILWRRLDMQQAYILFKIIEDAESISGEGNGTIWLTLPKVDASAPGQNWIDISGIGQLPNFETELQSNGRTYGSVVLTINAVVVENEPSNIF